MPNAISALMQAAQNRVSGAAQDVTSHIKNQFDPRGPLYKLGLGVGPLIKQTVAEYKKQQAKEDKKETEKSNKHLIDLKTVNKQTSTGIAQLNTRLDKMNMLLTDIRKINTAQLQSQQRVARMTHGTAYKLATESATSFIGTHIGTLHTDANGSGNGLTKDKDNEKEGSGLLKKAGLGIVAAIAGGFLYQNREQIGKFVDEFLQGAGLPTKEQLKTEAIKGIQNATIEVGRVIGSSLVTAATELVPDLVGEVKDRVRKALGIKEKTDKDGNPTGEYESADSRPLASGTAGIAGMIAGWKAAPGGWKSKSLGALAGGFGGSALGDLFPEATLATAGAAASYWLFKGKKVPVGTPGAVPPSAVAGGATAAGNVAGSAGNAAAAARADAAIAARQSAMEKEVADNIARQAAKGKPNPVDIPAYLRKAEGGMWMSQVPGNVGNVAPPNAAVTATERATQVAKEAISKIVSSSTAATAWIKDSVGGMTKSAEELIAKSPILGKFLGGATSAIKGNAIGGLISGGIDYAQHGDLTGALISAGLQVLLGGGGAALGTLAGGNTILGGFAGSLLADQLSGRINNWRRGGNFLPASTLANGLPSGFMRTSLNDTSNRPQVNDGAADGTWLRASQYINPVEGASPTLSGQMFGADRHDHTHKGVDFSRDASGVSIEGRPVVAARDGVVSIVGHAQGYGNRVIINHADGDSTLYAHLKEIRVKVNQKVAQGDIIGTVGNTGTSTAPHLHFEVRKQGVGAIDPMSVLPGGSNATSVAGNISSGSQTGKQAAEVQATSTFVKSLGEFANFLPDMIGAAMSAGGGGGGSGGGGSAQSSASVQTANLPSRSAGSAKSSYEHRRTNPRVTT